MTVHRRPRNNTRKANPNQLTFANEYRGILARVRNTSPGNLDPPDFEGTCTLNGDPYWISGWLNKRGARPMVDLVFQLAVAGSTPYRFKPDDLKLRTTNSREGGRPGSALNWTHYANAPKEHRESGKCEKCNLIMAYMDATFGTDPPY